MNTIQQDIKEYLSMRRNLGFKLRDAGNALLDFSSFMEKHRSRLDFKQVDAPLVVEFLNELENHRGLSTRSRNL